ncbi:MAG: winged helix-turn-helix domain-containing protein [Gammaproteobacteria bacterium]|nr:winged helix-turn-helix domain-containing protein [Gammaproteobacteria bacterium]
MPESRTDTQPPGSAAEFEFCGWRGRPDLLKVWRADKEVRIEPKVMQLLAFLVKAQGDPCTRATIMQAIWGHEHVTEDALNRLIARLRKLLTDELECAAYVETLPSVGYRLHIPADEHGSTNSAKSDSHLRYIVAALAGVFSVLILFFIFKDLTYTNGRNTVVENNATMRALPLTSLPGREIQPTISPDGSHIAFTYRPEPDGNWNIYVRPVNSEAMLQITENAGDNKHPAWSPDGEWLAFLHYQDNACEVRLVAPIGGGIRRVAECDAGLGDSLTWTTDGESLVFHPPGERGLYKISINTGLTRQLTFPPADVLRDSDAAFSPDGSSLAFIRWQTYGVADVFITTGEGGNAQRLTSDNQKLHGLVWDIDNEHILFSSNRAGGFALWRISAGGSDLQRMPVIGRSIDAPAISRDGRRLVYQEWHEITNVFAINTLAPGKETQAVTRSTRWDWNAQPTSDGSRMVFVSDRNGSTEIWVMNGPAPNDVMRLTEFNGPFTSSPAWSWNEQSIAFDSSASDGNFDIYLIHADGGSMQRLTEHAAADRHPHFSEDGEHLLFASQRSGEWEVWRLNLASGEKQPVTRNGGYFAFEDEAGRFYFSRHDVPGIWRKTDISSEPELILAELDPIDSVNWLLKENMIWYVERDEANQPFLALYDIENESTSRISPLENLFYKSGLGVDGGGNIYFSAVVRYEADLFMMENFN